MSKGKKKAVSVKTMSVGSKIVTWICLIWDEHAQDVVIE